jgi:hypothetical protein
MNSHNANSSAIIAGRSIEQLTAQRQKQAAAAIREEAEVANAREPRRKDMLKEAAQELFVSQRHRPQLAAMRVVLPPERHVVVCDVQ